MIRKNMESHRYSMLMALSSGILCHIAILHMVFLLAWVCYVPFFLSLKSKNGKYLVFQFFILGLGIALPSFWWIIPCFGNYTGAGIMAGVGLFLLWTLLFSIYWAIPGCLFQWLRISSSHKNGLFTAIQALLIISLMTLGEIMLKIALPGMPWFHYETGTGVLKNLYVVQHAAYFGLAGISFTMLGVNYLLAEFLFRRNRMYILGVVLFIPFYLGLGYLLMKGRTIQETLPKMKAALISGNYAPEIIWNDHSGNQLISTFFNLEKKAVSMQPDLIIWTESTVPWTYRKDDDFLKEMLRISSCGKINHILGMNTDFSQAQVYNSVYSLSSEGVVLGRYDKRFLLSLIEKPVSNYLLPFLSGDGSSVHPGEKSNPVTTAGGRAGILICNEAVLEQPADELADQGAEYFINLSNDGWFRDTYLVDLHFYQLRVRAVETGKDILINSNEGISGMIDAHGTIQSYSQTKLPLVKLVTLHPNAEASSLTWLRNLFPWLCLIPIIISILIRIRQSFRKNNKL